MASQPVGCSRDGSFGIRRAAAARQHCLSRSRAAATEALTRSTAATLVAGADSATDSSETSNSRTSADRRDIETTKTTEGWTSCRRATTGFHKVRRVVVELRVLLDGRGWRFGQRFGVENRWLDRRFADIEMRDRSFFEGLIDFGVEEGHLLQQLLSLRSANRDSQDHENKQVRADANAPKFAVRFEPVGDVGFEFFRCWNRGFHDFNNLHDTPQ